MHVGFSRIKTNLLLVVSTTGRSLIDCSSGEKIERDYKQFAGLDEWSLNCRGIGELQEETISICGLNGGGLPLSNLTGERLELVSPNWPVQDLILCREHKSALEDGHQSYCNVIYSDYGLRGFGFSWCGDYIVAACGSDLDVWERTGKYNE